jgi:hypothetical protein
MSRKDSERYLHMRLKVQRRRRFSAVEEKLYVRDQDEPGLSLSPAADAGGMPNSLRLRLRKALNGSVTNGALPGDAGASTPGLMDLRWPARELQRRLRNKTLENEILKEALEAAWRCRNQCAHRHRR